MLGREDILKAPQRTKAVEVPEWGGSVIVRELGAVDAEDCSRECQGQVAGTHTVRRAKWVAKCLIDEDGKLLFAEHDVKALGQLSSSAMERIFNEILALLRTKREEQLALVGESEAARGSGPSTGSAES